jgi:hypothetical protein
MHIIAKEFFLFAPWTLSMLAKVGVIEGKKKHISIFFNLKPPMGQSRT